MASLVEHSDRRTARPEIPPRWRMMLAVVLAALLGGAGVVIALRGEALLLDLAHLSRQMLCL